MKITQLFLAVLIAVSDLAFAEKTKRQNKMVTCNKQADGIMGEERKAFMSACLRKSK